MNVFEDEVFYPIYQSESIQVESDLDQMREKGRPKQSRLRPGRKAKYSDSQLTSKELVQRNNRRKRNKSAARRKREKDKELIATLSVNAEQLKEDNLNIENDIKELKRKITLAKQAVLKRGQAAGNCIYMHQTELQPVTPSQPYPLQQSTPCSGSQDVYQPEPFYPQDHNQYFDYQYNNAANEENSQFEITCGPADYRPEFYLQEEFNNGDECNQYWSNDSKLDPSESSETKERLPSLNSMMNTNSLLSAIL